jgi:2,3-bisphosphoglycerate-independent phosphoglycerate mutase
MSHKRGILSVLDGWGINKNADHNAIASARTPIYSKLSQEYPHALLDASGRAVGLPDGQMGNSEGGHLNLGAGRVVYQDSTRISNSIREGEFFQNPALLTAMATAKRAGAALHLMGLLSDGGVHSRLDHLFAMLDMAKVQGLKKVFFHAFLDGRDTPPASALRYLEQLEGHMRLIGLGKIATVTGRHYAMDRDQRWERIEQAYNAMVVGEGVLGYAAKETVQQSYDCGRLDEFMLPTVLLDRKTHKPVATIRDQDAVLFCNFRSDSARAMTRALTDSAFEGFRRQFAPDLASFVCLTTYDETLDLPIAFAPVRLANILGDVISKQGVKQLRIAETEK